MIRLSTLSSLVVADGGEISTNSTGDGRGGPISLQAGQIELTNGATVSARSAGQGNAGDIVIHASDTFRSASSAVTTAAEQAGGGSIVLEAGRLVQLIDSELTTTVQGGAGDAGNLTLDSQLIVADGSRIIANAFEGMGGNIRIGAEVFLADPVSQVSASSTLGIQGTVDIQAPVTSLSGALAPLPQAFVNVAALLPSRCAARAAGSAYSSLVLSARDGLPLDPGGLLPSPLAPDPWLGTTDPAGAWGPRRQQSTSRFALLHAADKGFLRLQGGTPQREPSAALAWGCSR